MVSRPSDAGWGAGSGPEKPALVKVFNALEHQAREIAEISKSLHRFPAAAREDSPRKRVRGLGRSAQTLADDPASTKALESLVSAQGATDALRANALKLLLERIPYAGASQAISGAFATGGERLLKVAVEAVSAQRDPCRRDVLAGLASTPHPEVAAGVAEALGRLRDPLAEPALLQLLARTELPVRKAAIASLARVGTLRSVEPLVPLARGLLGDPRLKDDASEAIRWIQGRYAQGDRGAVSLLEDRADDGGLSLGPAVDGAKRERGS